MKRKGMQGGALGKSIAAFRKEFILAGIFSLIANLLLLTPTMYMLQVYDRVLVSRNELTLLVITLVLILFYAAMAYAEWLRSRLLVRIGVRLDEELSAQVFHSSFESYLRNAAQKSLNPLSDLVTVRQFFTGNGIISFFDLPWIPVYILITFLLHPYLGWLSVLFACVQLVVTYTANRVAVKGIEDETNSAASSNTFVQSKLRNIEAVHAMGMVPHMRDRWVECHEASLAQNEDSRQRLHRQQSFSKFVRYCMQSFTLGAGALLVIDGKLTPGAMIAGNVLMARALQPLDQIIATWQLFIQARMSMRQLDRLLDEYPRRTRGAVHGDPRGAIRLEGLSATAAGRPAPILQDVTLDIPAGTVVAVLGPSGSGKSTLARCLVGVWPEVQGNVLLDNEPLQSWDRMQLGPHIGYLPQDVELFDGTIAENIARFAEVDARKVIEAARKTGIHEMILRFPRGYDTEIGEAGGVLSGGQRQRIALARALYGDPAFLVLDEPNANLDDGGERSLLQTVRNLKAAGKTVVLVTHRVNILGAADLLLVLENGRIALFGPPDAVAVAQVSQPRPLPAGAV